MNIFFIGMGNMGRHRLNAIKLLSKEFNLNVVGFYDPHVKSVVWNEKTLVSVKNFDKGFLEKNNIDFFVIGTPHELIFGFIQEILVTSKKCVILVEKPLGVDYSQAKKIGQLKNDQQKIFVGLNYRYFDGINLLLNDLNQNKFGHLNSLNITMGHGHSSSIINSWKINKKAAGGGVIIDPGIHVINLMQLFTGNEVKIVAKQVSCMNFWRTGIEEQCNLLFESKKVPLVSLNISILRWRSSFTIEVFGNNGYGIINGRGSHYGDQVYRTGERWSWEKSEYANQIDTETQVSRSKGEDVFFKELYNVFKCLNGEECEILPCLFDEALETMRLTSKIYEHE